MASLTLRNIDESLKVKLRIMAAAAFKGERFGDRDKIRRIKLSISCDLEPIPYNPLDFNSNNPFVKRILRTGIRVV